MNSCGCIGDVNPLPKMSLVNIFKLQYGNISVCTKYFCNYYTHCFFFFFFFFFFKSCILGIYYDHHIDLMITDIHNI